MRNIYKKLQNTLSLLHVSLLALLCFGASSAYAAPIVGINGFSFDLAQFTGATVTYRASPPGSVSFDGKLWDNANGVNLFALGELAAGQFGSDPGDQVSLNDRTTPDWLQLNYATPIEISPTAHEVVIYEITSNTVGAIDTEGTSFKVELDGDTVLRDASDGVVSYYAASGSEENTNQIVFDLYNFGFVNGDLFNTLYIENVDSGSGTSDPDFIFAGIAGDLSSASVPEPGIVALLGIGLLGLALSRSRQVRV